MSLCSKGLNVHAALICGAQNLFDPSLHPFPCNVYASNKGLYKTSAFTHPEAQLLTYVKSKKISCASSFVLIRNSDPEKTKLQVAVNKIEVLSSF